MIKSPEKLLFTPVYASSTQNINVARFGELCAPKTAQLDLDDLFDGRDNCLLDYLSKFDNGYCAVPEYVVYLVKRGVTTGSGGWTCHYSDKAKVVHLERIVEETQDLSWRPKPNVLSSGVRDPTKEKCQDPFKYENFSDFADEDFGETADDEWDMSEEDEVGELDRFFILEDDSDRQLVKKCSSKDDDRQNITSKLQKKIDGANYCVYTTAKDNRLVVMWRRREKLKHLTRYKESQRKIKRIQECKHLHASRSSSISLRGVPESIKRAEEWQQWHSEIYIDIPSLLTMFLVYLEGIFFTK